ncbi:MAG: UvrD-helicase domain-containing protein [Planctomycetales bacterium]
MNAPPDVTPAQWQAIDHFEGPLLVLAGPGSGKTRVITRRIARLIEKGVSPREILAITFTNKAANEMAERVEKLLPGTHVWVSTFHRFCAKLLRWHGQSVGLQPNFTILDASDQRAMLKLVLADMDQDISHVPIGQVASRISRAKNRLQTPEHILQQSEEGSGTYLDRCVAHAYRAYQKALLASNAVDFDDLLMHVALMLQEQEGLRRQWDRRFRFTLVDEYQDTNLAQYQIVRALSVDYPNLCATGDPDQSIYGWRGAELDNILRFEHDFPDPRIVRLEENFRSTKSILQAADQLIKHNVHRKAKDLHTANPQGQAVELITTQDATEEAEQIASIIRQEVQSKGRPWSDFAVLYRVNALSRRLEIAALRQRIPYQVAAGVAFYERAEVKDLLAYLRLIHNPSDLSAFQRVLGMSVQCFGNKKKKILQGISKQSQTRVIRWAERQQITLSEAVKQASIIPQLSKQAVPALKRFGQMWDELIQADNGSVEGLLQKIVHRTQYTSAWEQSQVEQDMQRLANVEELIASARHHDETHPAEDSLAAFLEECSLVADLDSVDTQAGKVTFMTLHAAKGLEFPVVFVLGVEHNLLPHERSLKSDNPRELEEERRLLFVGMTRAKQELYLTYTNYRDMHGQTLPTIPSSFLEEISVLQPREAAPLESPDLEVRRPDVPRAEISPRTPAASTGTPESLKRMLGGVKLTTAAALLQGKHTPAEIPIGFTVGMRVRHPQQGTGSVVEIHGAGGKWKTIVVEFDSGEHASFLAQKCPLQPIGAG